MDVFNNFNKNTRIIVPMCNGKLRDINHRRGPIAGEFSGPGPAAIALPTLFGNANIRESNKPKSPAFSFGLKLKPPGPPVSPSPNAYNTSGLTVKGKDSAPASSLHIKIKEAKKLPTPSPGSYNPHTADKEIQSTAPVYSFGIKPGGRSSGHSPAPNAYNVGPARDAPSYSLSARIPGLKQPLTPAPGNYETCAIENYMEKSPRYSLAMRYNPPKDRVGKPGPGAYMSEKVNLKTSAPEYSFGVRHSNYVFQAKHDPEIPVRPLPY